MVAYVATSAQIQALTPAQIAALPPAYDSIDASDDVLTLSLPQALALGPLLLDPSDTVTVTGTSFQFRALTPTQIAALAAAGVDRFDSSNNVIRFTAAGAEALGNIALTAADINILSDNGVAIAGLSAASISTLVAKGLDSIEVSDGLLTLSLSQYAALGAVAVPSTVLFTLQVSAAELQAMTPAQISALGGPGVDIVQVTGAPILSVAQYTAMGSLTIEGGNATIADTGAAIAAMTGVQIGQLASKGFSSIDVTDNAVTLSFQQALALGPTVFSAEDVVTVVANSFQFAALDAAQIAALAASGVDVLDSSNDVIRVTVEEAAALGGITFAGSDNAILSDTGAAIASLTPAEIAALGGQGFDSLEVIDGILTLSYSQYAALGSIAVSSMVFFTLQISASEIEALSPAQIAALTGPGIDVAEVSGSPSLTVAQYAALGALTIQGGNATLADTGAAIAAMSPVQIAQLAGKGFSTIDATDNAVTLSFPQMLALGSLAFDASDAVRVTGTSFQFAALDAAQIAGLSAAGVDVLDASNDVIRVTVETAAALGGIAFAGSDNAILSDTGAAIAAMTPAELSALVAKGLDRLEVIDGALTLSQSQYAALGGASVPSTTLFTLQVSAAELEAMSPAQIAALSGPGIDVVQVSGSPSLTVAQYASMGALTIQGGTGTLADTGAAIAGMTAAQFGQLAGKGFSTIDAINDAISLSITQALALNGVMFASGDTVTVTGNSFQFRALDAGQISALNAAGVDAFDCTNDILRLSVAGALALGNIVLTAGDNNLLSDTGTAIAALTPAQLADLVARGLDGIETSNASLTLSLSQFQALGSTSLTGAGFVTLQASAAAIEAMTPAEIAALASAGVDFIEPDTAVALNVAQYLAMGTLGFTPAGIAVLSDTGAAIAAMSSGQFAGLEARGFGSIDATDDFIGLLAGKAAALGGVTIASGDTLALQGTAAGETLEGHDGDGGISGGAGNDTMTGNGGADVFVLAAGDGSDTITDFNPGDGDLINVTAYGFTSTSQFASFTFDGFDTIIDFNGVDGLVVQWIDLTSLPDPNAAFVLEPSSFNNVNGTPGNDVLIGTAGDDLYLPGGTAPGGEDVIQPSAGNDQMDFAGAAAGGGFYSLAYGLLPQFTGLTANIGPTGGTIVKSGLGTDTLLNLDQIDGNTGGLGIYAPWQGNDSYAIDTSGVGFFDLQLGGGNDTLAVSGSGVARVGFGSYAGVNVDAVSGTATELGGGSSLAVTGFVGQWRGSSFTDSFLGSAGNEHFITEQGDDYVDGGDGFDTMRYDRPGVTNLVVNYTAQGSATITGLWNGQRFTDTIVNVEAVRGARIGLNQFYGSDGNERFDARGGVNYFEGGAGNDTMNAGGVQNLFAFEPGSGQDSVGGFVIGRDLVDLSGYGLSGTGDFASFTFNGSATIIDLGGGDTITFAGVDLTTADPAQVFVFASISGTAGNDNDGELGAIFGTAANESIDGLGGDDELFGQEGKDILSSGGQNLGWGSFDRLEGGGGDDVLIAEGGDVILVGGQGNDLLIANFTLGDPFWDGARADYSASPTGIVANLSASTYLGVASMRVSDGWGSLDTLLGVTQLRDSDHDDIVRVDGSYFTAFGNAFEVRLSGGNDTVDFSGMTGLGRISYQLAGDGVVASLATGTAHDINLGNGDQIGNDTFIGANLLRGSAFGDELYGNGGDNRLRGEGGDDYIDGGNGFDRAEYWGSSAGITVDLSLPTGQVTDDGFGGVDTLVSIELVSGSIWDDTMSGGSGDDVLWGIHGNDVLSGGDGNDQLVGDWGSDGGGSGGDDILDGGAGDDWLRGGDDADTFVFQPGSGNDTIADFTPGDGDLIDVSAYGITDVGQFAGFAFNGFATIIDFNGFDSVTVDGIDLTNLPDPNAAFIFGSGSTNVVNGTPGNDALIGTNGNDLFLPGETSPFGGDDIQASPGNDEIDFSGTGANGGFYTIGYWQLGNFINTTINIGATSGTIVKHGFGTDTLSNIDLIDPATGGVGVYLGYGGNDNVTVDTSGVRFFDLGVGAGTDTISVSGTGSVRLDFRSYNGVVIDAMSGTATEIGGGASLTVTSGFINQWQGSGFADTMTGTTANEMFATLGGDDTVDGGGGFDTVRYDRNGVTDLVVQYTAQGTATVTGNYFGVAFTDTLTSIEAIRGAREGVTQFGGSAGNERFDARGGINLFEAGGGNDVMNSGGTLNGFVFGPGSGNDTINGFVLGRDLIILQPFGFTDTGDFAAFTFDGNDTLIDFGGGDSVTITGIDLTGADPAVLFDFTGDAKVPVVGTTGNDVLNGTVLDDRYQPLSSAPGGEDTILASDGNDEIDFDGAAAGSWYSLGYYVLDAFTGLTVNIGATTGTIVKDGYGTDTLVNLDQIDGNTGGIGIYAPWQGNDTYTIDTTGVEFMEIGLGGGADTVTGSGSGALRLRFDNYDGVTVDASTGTATEIGGSSSTTFSGSNITQFQGSSFNDVFIGSNANETFITGSFSNATPGAANSVDGGGGFDTVRYDRPGVTNLVVEYTAQGSATVTGIWNGQNFTDTLVNVEAVRGARVGTTQFLGSEGDERFDARGGVNYFEGGGGNDTLNAGGIANLFSFETGSGQDTINNYVVGRDLIDLSGYGLSGTGDFGSFTFNGFATVIDLGGGDGITVNGVDLVSADPAQVFVFGAIEGTPGNDNAAELGAISGTAGNEAIDGLGGNDEIFGNDGMDILLSGGQALGFDGIDRLDGGNGSDILVAEGGLVDMIGGQGNDKLIATQEYGDPFWDGARANYASSPNGIVANLTAGSAYGLAAFTVSDGWGTLDTLAGINQIRDSDHNDIFRVDGTYGTAFGNTIEVRLSGGDDQVDFTGMTGLARISYQHAGDGVVASLVTGTAYDINPGNGDQIGNDTFIGANLLRGSQFGDELYGNDGDNRFRGEGGSDHLDGGDGIDRAEYWNASTGIIVDLSLPNNQVIADGYGSPDTLVSIEIISGSMWGDTMTGGDGDDRLWGQQGNDILTGGNGNDQLIGDFGDGGGLPGGDDQLFGGAGDDWLVGGVGADILDGGSDNRMFDEFWVGDAVDYGASDAGVTVNLATGTGIGGHAEGDTLTGIERVYGSEHGDTLTGSAGADELNGWHGDDIIHGGGGNDGLLGSDGADQLFGEDGADWLNGGDGDDLLDGGSGDDTFLGGAGNDTIVGGDGFDQATYENEQWGINANLFTGIVIDGSGGTDTLSGIELLIGSNFDDILIGGLGDDVFRGNGGNDTIDGGGGNDRLEYFTSQWGIWVDLSLASGQIISDGLGGTDTISNIGEIIGSLHNDEFQGSDGDDRFHANDGNDNFFGHDGNDFVDGGQGDDNLHGDGGNDNLNGGDGNDQLYGGDGTDYLVGGAGNDIIDGGNGDDVVSYEFDPFGINANLFNGTVSDGYGGFDTVTNVKFLAGSQFDDFIVGRLVDDSFRGNGGNDTIDGGGGTDSVDHFNAFAGVSVDLSLASGQVIDDGQGGTDTLISIEHVYGSNHGDSLLGNASDNWLFGWDGDDTLEGRDGNDHLEGGAGADTIDGGDGIDFVSYSTSGSGVTINLATGFANGGHATGDVLTNIEDIGGSLWSDDLTGTSGSNAFNGQAGDDILTGNGGADLFFFEYGDGNDTITDFVAGAGGQSQIGIAGLSFGLFSYLDVMAVTTQVGGDAVIQLSANDSITLTGVDMNNLDSGDFSFV